jgi:predicted GIY-YIG superfamily endonuclease
VNFTKQEIHEFVTSFESELLTSKKVVFTFDKFWSNNFPKEPGIYAIFNKEGLIYIGETANLKERMKEVKRTVNHSFRRKLGKHLNAGAVVTDGKFSSDIEEALNDYYLSNITFSYKVLLFGRLEVESHLIHRNHANGLINSLGKRNRIS